MLHEMELQQFPEQQARLHDSLPQLMQDAAAALLQHHQILLTNSDNSESQQQQQQQQQQQHVLMRQLADMLFALAVHAVDCEATAAAAAGSRDGSSSSSGGGSSAWYLCSGCVALVDAVASCSSTWDCCNMARGVSARNHAKLDM
jgi:hypothetical protein